ncbi:TNT antitoxin family protein [Mycobacterium sp.]|jgi:hypothetical protein|uniref:TNT antitoxin family protein n=1 Tax=Mycobacterium sp. TaxID=1785 RepID=UPI00261DB250|nr:TNT antitoxin family protein [Mycobacterium sp.]
MTSSVDLSPDLVNWIRLAGMDLIQGSQTSDRRTVIWNAGGERRYFVGVDDGFYVITSSDRMGAESFHFAANTTAVIEKYLYAHFGGSVRKLHGLQRIQKPFTRDELKEGFHIGETVFAGHEQDALIDPAGSLIAIAADDRLVELSHYLDASVDTIKESFNHPDGKPLFTPLV